jgi:hypothetical protein
MMENGRRIMTDDLRPLMGGRFAIRELDENSDYSRGDLQR